MANRERDDSRAFDRQPATYYEDVIEEFERAWMQGDEPEIEAYLPTTTTDYGVLLVELVHADLEFRIKKGEQVRLESYLTRFPKLSVDDKAILNLIQREFELRARRDRSVTVEEYFDRFPGLRHELSTLGAAFKSKQQPPADPVGRAWGADDNLLFGVIALQMDFIRREQLIAGTSTWLMDKSERLDGILVEQGALSVSDCHLLIPLVERHLENHNLDAQESLAALSSIGSLTDELRGLGDDDVEQSLVVIGRNRQDAKHSSSSGGKEVNVASRYQVLRPHAKGGLGEVSVAQDTELNRQVALKEIQSRYADDEESRLRFILEAEVTGGLEHPGIVPVYGLGQYDDGRPFYAMRFIKGNSLAEAADRIHQRKQEPKQSEPSRRTGEVNAQIDYSSVAFRQLLGRFVDVCQAIEYAHSRGVLHRDLKPGNIMLGRYGETLVVDWGLAKSQSRVEVDLQQEESTLRPSSSSGGSATLAGSALGTPAFMPPEQAAGRLEELGPASDVYSLGATLYYLMTGSAPFSGPCVSATLSAVESGEFKPPREVSRAIPKQLEAVCLKAMSLRPGDRYAAPRALSDDVECYLAGEAVSAFREPWTARARRWVRKHQTLTTTGAAVVLVSTIGLAVFSSVVSNMNTQLGDLNKSLTKTNRELDLSYKELAQKNVALDEANKLETKARLKAERLFKDVRELAHTFVFDINDAIEDLQGATPARKMLVETALEYLNRLSADANDDLELRLELAMAYQRIGDILGHPNQNNLGDRDGAFKSYEQSLRLWEGLRDAVSERDYTTFLGLLHDRLGKLSMGRGELDKAKDHFIKIKDLASKIVDQDPGDLDNKDAVWVAINRLGDLDRLRGNLDEAMIWHKEGLKLAERLVKEHPEEKALIHRLFSSHTLLAQDYLDQRENVLAQPHVEMQFQIAIDRLAEDDSSVAAKQIAAHAATKYGIWLSRTDQVEEARKKFELALRHYQDVVDADPQNDAALDGLARASNLVGDLLEELGRLDEAEQRYQLALTIQEKRYRADPKSVRTQQSLSIGQQNVAIVAEARKQYKVAKERYEECIEVREQLLTIRANVASAKNDLAYVEWRLALLLATCPDSQFRDPAAAVRHATRACELLEYKDMDALKSLAVSLAASNDFDAVDEILAKLRAVAGAEYASIYDVACAISLCAAAINPEEGQALNSLQSSRRQKWIDEALTELKKSIDGGWDRFEHMQMDSDLKILHDLPEFKALLPESR